MRQVHTKELEPVVKRLDDAIANHRLWMHSFMRSVTCNLEHPSTDKQPDAHHHCEFGKWYYGHHPALLTENDTFKQIEGYHRKLHVHAANMLHTQEHQQQVFPADFDEFYLELGHFIKAIEKLKAEIQELLYNRDTLTGAYNRATLGEELYQVREMVRQNVNQACILMLDLDYFKSVNDNYGHPFGDYVLRVTAKYILDNLRSFDKLFRYGGEEFLITLINTDLETAMVIAERMRKGIADLIIDDGNNSIKLTASLGLSLVDPMVKIEQNIERADKALYQAKHSGRNRTEVWQAEGKE